MIIKSTAYQDSSKILTILKSPTNTQEENVNLSIAELISLAHKDNNYKQNLTKELTNLLNKLPKPQRKEDLTQVNIATPSAISSSLQEANWNIDIEINNNFLHIGKRSITGSDIFLQTALIPISNKELARVNLYLNCFSCSGEGIDAL